MNVLRYTKTSSAFVRPGRPDRVALAAKVYPSGAAFYNPIINNPVIDGNSDGMVTTFNQRWQAGTTQSVMGLNIYEYGVPIYEIPIGGSAPTYTFDANAYNSHVVTVRIPDNAAPSPGTDKAFVVIDWPLNRVYEFWNTTKGASNWNTGGTAAIFPITGNGINDSIDGVKGAVGAGFSRYHGLLTKKDFEAGFPNGTAGHALVFSVPFAGGPSGSSNYREPATKTDGNNIGGYTGTLIPEAARLQISPAFNVETSGMTNLEKFIMRTMQVYGGYVMDNGGSNSAMLIMQGNDLTKGTGPTQPGNPADSGGWGQTYGIMWDYYGMTGATFKNAFRDHLRVLAKWDGTSA